MTFTPVARPGVLHAYTSRLVAFEHCPLKANAPGKKNTLLFLGGLGDGIGHPHYPAKLAPLLPDSWRIVEVNLTCSYGGWTTSNLESDAKEVENVVEYFRRLDGHEEAKIVLMGHSTGSQICMEYITSRSARKAEGSSNSVGDATSPAHHPRVNGIILQAGISDREGATLTLSPTVISTSLALAHAWVTSGRGNDILPSSAIEGVFGNSNPSASRWISLVEKGGGDDYFSSDLPDEEFKETFGELGRQEVPLLCLLGGEDEYMPDWVDKEGLLRRWRVVVEQERGVWDEGSAIVEGAGHALNGGHGVIEDVAGRIGSFLGRV